MKTIGLIGGMSWESSLEYYRIINETAKELLGELHSAKSIMYTFDFDEIELLQREGRWNELSERVTEIALKLERAGADMIVICTNTTHIIADEVQKKITIPLIHIADSTAKKIIELSMKKVGLLGTKFTMEKPFYKDRLAEKYDLDVIIPKENDRQIIHDIIYKELVLGQIKSTSKQQILKMIEYLKANGAEGIILGCTEIPLIIKQQDVDIHLFDTTMIHARSAVYHAITEE